MQEQTPATGTDSRFKIQDPRANTCDWNRFKIHNSRFKSKHVQHEPIQDSKFKIKDSRANTYNLNQFKIQNSRFKSKHLRPEPIQDSKFKIQEQTPVNGTDSRF